MHTASDQWIRLLSDKDITNAEISEQVKLPIWHGFDLTGLRKKLQATAKHPHLLQEWLYRPFDVRPLLFDTTCIKRPRGKIMGQLLKPNIALITVRQLAVGGFRHVFATSWMGDGNTISLNTREYNYYFPLYIYPDIATAGLFNFVEPTNTPGGRHPNLSMTFITDISNKLNMQFTLDGKGDLVNSLGPEDIFNYMYAVFHSPTYRTRYSEFLKMDFPRLPLTSNPDLFRELCAIGNRLVELHLMEQYGEHRSNYPEPGNNMVEKVEYTQPTDKPDQGCVWINKTQYFDGVPPDVWKFHVGGYQVCHKWLKDRKGRQLDMHDVVHYERIVGALVETITLMEQIDEAIVEHGGWPIE